MALGVSVAFLTNCTHTRDQAEDSESANERSIEAGLRDLSRPRIVGVRGFRRCRVVRPSRGGLVLHRVRNTHLSLRIRTLRRLLTSPGELELNITTTRRSRLRRQRSKVPRHRPFNRVLRIRRRRRPDEQARKHDEQARKQPRTSTQTTTNKHAQKAKRPPPPDGDGGPSRSAGPKLSPGPDDPPQRNARPESITSRSQSHDRNQPCGHPHGLRSPSPAP